MDYQQTLLAKQTPFKIQCGDNLKTQQIEKIDFVVKNFINGSISFDQAVLQLREGADMSSTGAAILLFMVLITLMNSYGVEAFKSLIQPTLDFINWGYNKPYQMIPDQRKPPFQFQSQEMQNQCQRTLEFESKQWCSASAHENGYVMTNQEAEALLLKAYPGALEIIDHYKVSDWQAVKKSYHAPGVGIIPEDYGFPSEHLNTLRSTPGGLVTYLKLGGELPPIEFIHAYQNKIKEICLMDGTKINYNATVNTNGVKEPATMFYNQKTLEMASFRHDTGDLINANHWREDYFNASVKSGEVTKGGN